MNRLGRGIMWGLLLSAAWATGGALLGWFLFFLVGAR